MLKQVILILLLSALAIVFKDQLSHALDSIVYIHNSVAQALHLVFSDDEVGMLIQEMISLLLIPVICGSIVAVGFWLMKRATMPHIMVVIWVVWMVLLVTMLAQNGIVMEATQATPAQANAKLGNKNLPANAGAYKKVS